MKRRATITALAGLLVLAAAVVPARAAAILTLSGGEWQPDANGSVTVIVNVDLAGAATNLVGFEFDLHHAGLLYTSHSIGDVFDPDGDPSTIDYLDFTAPDGTGSTQTISSGLNAPFLGSPVGRLFSVTLSVINPFGPLGAISLVGFPGAEELDGIFRSESLVTEVSPFDIRPVPFIITLTSSSPGVITLLLTRPRDPDPPTVSEPTTLWLLGSGLIAMVHVRRRRRTREAAMPPGADARGADAPIH